MPLPPGTQLLEDVIRSLGLKFRILEKEHGYLVRIEKKGRYLNLISPSININNNMAVQLCKDKAYTYMVLCRAEIKVPRGNFFFRPDYFEAPDYSISKGIGEALDFAPLLAKETGYPLVVKPNHLSRGRGVSIIRQGDDLAPAIQLALGQKNTDESSFESKSMCEGTTTG